MLKFIFKSGNRTVDPKIVRRSPIFARLSSDFVRAIRSTGCPNHMTESSATVLIDTVTSSDWQIIDSCCSDYKKAQLCIDEATLCRFESDKGKPFPAILK